MPEVTDRQVSGMVAQSMRRAFGFDRDSRPALPVVNDDLSTYEVIQSYDRTRNAINFRAKCQRMGVPASVLMTLDNEWVFVGQIENQSRAGRVDTVCTRCRYQMDRNALSLPIISMDQFRLQTDTHHCYVWHGECSDCATPHWCHSPIMENE